MSERTQIFRDMLKSQFGVVVFLITVLPIVFLTTVLLQFQVTDIGGARRDATVGHMPLIQHIAEFGKLPVPLEYPVANIPLWHFLVAGVLNLFGSTIVIHLIQYLLAIGGLYLLYTVLQEFTTRKFALLGIITLGLNSYFVSSSFYPTTDGLAIFTFSLFVWSLQRILKTNVSARNLFYLNLSITVSVLNRQMFLFLFVIFFLALIRKYSPFKLIILVFPSLILVAVGFLLFYVSYCGFPQSDACWPVRQSRDVSFPVLVNFPVVCFLTSLFCFPILFVNRNFKFLSRLKLFLIIGAVSIFFVFYGERLIQSQNMLVGGGVFKFRQALGAGAVFFDIASVSTFLVVILLAVLRLDQGKFFLIGLVVLTFSSVFGPFSFQRYYEPYLILTSTCYILANSKDLFSRDSSVKKFWFISLLGFQFSELVLSLFVKS